MQMYCLLLWGTSQELLEEMPRLWVPIQRLAYLSLANGAKSLALGYNSYTDSTGDRSIAVGKDTFSLAPQSNTVALGYSSNATVRVRSSRSGLSATAINSLAIGYNAVTNQDDAAVIGTDGTTLDLDGNPVPHLNVAIDTSNPNPNWTSIAPDHTHI